MIKTASLQEIIATYAKHGWVLRRLLLSPQSKETASGTMTEVLGNVPIMDSEIDAAWFSRPPKPGGVAWELRYLGTTPFALVELVDENSDDFQAALATVERRLQASVAAKESA